MPNVRRYPGLPRMIEDIRSAKKWEQTELAAALGANQSRISRWENGEGISASNLDRIRRLWLQLCGSKVQKSSIVTVVGRVGVDAMVQQFKVGSKAAGLIKIKVELEVPQGYVGFLVDGASLSPFIDNGDVLIFGSETLPDAQAFEKSAIIHLEDGREYFGKLLSPINKDGRYNIKGHSGAYIKNAAVKSCRALKFVIKNDAYSMMVAKAKGQKGD